MLEILEYRTLAAVAEGKNPGTASSMLEDPGHRAQPEDHRVGAGGGRTARTGVPAARDPPGGPVTEFTPPPDGYVSGEEWQAVAPLLYFNNRAGSIYAGSNEIQRNILAKAALGL